MLFHRSNLRGSMAQNRRIAPGEREAHSLHSTCPIFFPREYFVYYYETNVHHHSWTLLIQCRGGPNLPTRNHSQRSLHWQTKTQNRLESFIVYCWLATGHCARKFQPAIPFPSFRWMKNLQWIIIELFGRTSLIWREEISWTCYCDNVVVINGDDVEWVLFGVAGSRSRSPPPN